MKNLTATGINNLNTALIILSALVAWLLPFELFLFSYAVLGPLHYFTEISWLHDRKYYLPTLWHSAPLYGLTAIRLMANTLKLPPLGLTFLALGFAALATQMTSGKKLLMGCVLLILFSQWSVQFSFFNILFAALLPTLIHVCLFTFCFMLLGSMKSNSISGYISLLVYCVCAVAVLILPEQNHYIVKKEHFNAAEYFVGIANYMTQLLHRGFTTDTLTSAFRFIAFSYTYHYLNWFSKTNLINWHKMSKKRGIVIAVLWISSLGLYAVDYKMGLTALLLFSTAHVFLEFPLNMKSFKEISTGLSRLARKTRASKA
jgi:hypothetical protein